MKKIFVIGLASTLTLGASISAVAASPKVGGTCSPVNSKTTYQGKVFTCVKSGKKSIWNAGVAQPNKVAPTQPAIVPAVDINRLTADSVYKRSRQEIKNAISNSENFSNPLVFLVGAKVDSWRVDIAKQQYNDAVKLWSREFKPLKVTVLLYSYADIEWAKKRYTEITGRPSSNSLINDCQPTYCGNATATTYTDADGKLSRFVEQGLAFSDAGLWNRSTAVHEYTHEYQASILPNFWQVVPWWAIEGSAQFYGEATSYVAFDDNKATRSEMHTQYTRDVSGYIEANYPGKTLKALLLEAKPANSVALMKAIESSNNNMQLVGLAYLLGSYATEVLVATYGQSKFVEFYNSFAISADYQANFKKVFGMTPDAFYEKLTPYFAEMAKTELK